MGKTKAAVKKVPAVKKDVKPEVKKDAKEEVKATVRLKEPFMSLKPGVYEVEAFTGDGNPIVKTANGPVTVALDLVDVIPLKGTKAAALPIVEGKKKQLEMKDPHADADFYVDPSGQMTINKIDTPMGKLAQRIIRADIEINKITSECDRQIEKIMRERSEDEEVMMSEMKKLGSKKITVLGKVIVYKLGKPTHDCLEIKDQK
jgi:hypothetical protein